MSSRNKNFLKEANEPKYEIEIDETIKIPCGTKGVIDHLKKEIEEIESEPDDLEEWIDVMTLAIDGAWRSGYEPHEIAKALGFKLQKNINRDWPDWRTQPADKAIEHVRSE